MATSTTGKINGIDTTALRAAIEGVAADASTGMTNWKVATTWKGGARSDSQVTGFGLGGQWIERAFTIRADEPLELCGSNEFANPQDYLIAGLNACMAVGYAAVCALEGIELQSLRIETSGDIDLRGFFGLDPNVKAGYDRLSTTVTIKAKATKEQIEKVHAAVAATSPNRFNLANAITLESRLVVE